MYSQTAEYALRAMACLAIRPADLTPTTTLAKQTNVPVNYLAKVLQHLAGAQLISGRRGVGGGYKLARPAKDISLLQVINAVSPVERITTCPLNLPNHSAVLCPLHRRADEAAAAVIKIFGSTSLADLLTDPKSPKPLCDATITAKLTPLGVLPEGR